MDKGDKTKALGAAATTNFGTALSGPTGASAISFLTVGTGLAIGSAYKFAPGSIKRIQDDMAYNRRRKATANVFNLKPAVHYDEFLDTAHQYIEEATVIGMEDIGVAQELSDEMVQIDPSAETTDSAFTPPDEYENHIGLENEFASSNMDGETKIRWGDPVSPGEMLTAGARAAVSDIVVKNVVGDAS